MALDLSKEALATSAATKRTIMVLEEKGYVDECKLVRFLQSCREYKKPSVTGSSKMMNANGAKVVAMFAVGGSMYDITYLLPKETSVLAKNKKFKATTFDDAMTKVQMMLYTSARLAEVAEVITASPP